MAFKRRLRFDKRIRFRKSMSIMYILLFVVLASLGVGYSYIKSNLNINGTANVTAANWDVHFDNINVITGSVTASSPATITNPTTVEFAVTLEEPNDFYEFTVDIVNGGTIDAMIDDFAFTPRLTSAQAKYLEYFVKYSDGASMRSGQELKAGTTETLKVIFDYIEIDDKTNYPTEDQSLNISFSIDYIQADGSEIPVDRPVSFATDDWNTIANAVINGNTSKYNVGDTRTIDMGTFGTHTLRIANKSTPSECNTTGFSQTACGFVVEFADVIIEARMNPDDDFGQSNGNGDKGGWRYSEMRTYLNSDIYNALPTDLKNSITSTYVVSGYNAYRDSANFETSDNLYLLSTKEVYGKNGTSNVITGDTAEAETRQLDYYSNKGVTTDNYAEAIKKMGSSNEEWWLRTAAQDNYGSGFFSVSSSGLWREVVGYQGVSPAFKIGFPSA